MGPDVAGESDARVVQRAHGHEGAGHAAFHVRRAATPEAPGVGLATPRIVRPSRVVADWHDVDVAVESQRATAAGARQFAGHDRVAGRFLPAFDARARFGEPSGDDALASLRFRLEFGVLRELAIGPAGD
jgi:hypothetical protein